MMNWQINSRRFYRACVIGSLGFIASAMPVNPALAEATLSGVVRSANAPVAAATVTVTNSATGIAQSVFSAKDGRYSLQVADPGEYSLRALHGTLASSAVALTVTDEQDLVTPLAVEVDPNYLARVPSNQWLALLPDGDMKREFILNCTSCHELDAARLLVDGEPRTQEQWTAAFALMRAIDQYELLPPDFEDARYFDWLNTHLTASRIAPLVPDVPADPDGLANVRITEYPLPNNTDLPHDLVVGPAGRIWITAFFSDVIWALEPVSGAIQSYRVRPEGAPGLGQARALEFDRHGMLWVVLGGTHELVRLDPNSGEFKTYNVGMYPHSMAIASDDRIWFNDYFAKVERIGVFDPRTEQATHHLIPSAGLTEAQGLPLPYGLQIDSVGRVYSTQLAGNTIVMYDTRDGTSQLFTMPGDNLGPRRPAIGDDDSLWVPEWNTGGLTRFNPADGSFKRYEFGDSALGPYDVEIDRKRGDIWITGALAASMVVFNSRTEQTLEIPFPTNPAYTRHLAVDPRNGDLWSAYSSLPAAEPRVVRIERLP